MPYEIQIDADAHIAYVIGSGATDASEGHAVLVELAAHPDFEPGFGLVFDVRQMDFEPTTEDMMGGLENVVQFRPLLRSRMAIVPGPALEMPSELSAALYAAEGFEAQVFSNLAEARKWVAEAVAAHSAA